MRAEQRQPTPSAHDRLHLEPRLVMVLIALIVVLAGIGAVRLLSGSASHAAPEITAPEIIEPSSGAALAVAPSSLGEGQSGGAPAAPVIVYVTGAVADPGVKQLRLGDRVVDALEAAGGTSADAALDSLNLARTVGDGEHLHMPTVDEAASGIVVEPSSRAGPDESCVDLNRADEAQLETLDGIGPALASRIVAHREEIGQFSQNESLLEVAGIGAKKYSGLVGQLCP